eukprot:Skav210980  [mRNA]  locus=scaffold712:336637:344883:- [translate_table: standard]
MKVCATLGFHVALQHQDLATFGPMTRKRCFMFFNPVRAFEPFPPVDSFWDADKHLLTDPQAIHPAHLSGDDANLLSQVQYLPSHLKPEAILAGLHNPQHILKLRVHEGVKLPTLLASYSNQSKLDRQHLAQRGIFAFLIEDSSAPFGCRYLDVIEALRALGFLSSLVLPTRFVDAMHCLGNALAPPQALLAIRSLFDDSQVISWEQASHTAAFWLHGQVPVPKLTKVWWGEFMSAALIASRPPRDLSLGSTQVCCHGKVFPTRYDASFGGSKARVLDLLPLGSPWEPVEVARVLSEDSLLLLVRVQPLEVRIDLSTGSLTCPVSPLDSIHKLCGALALDGVCSSFLEVPVWIWAEETVVQLSTTPRTRFASHECLFLFGQEVKVWQDPLVSVGHAVAQLYPCLYTSSAYVTLAGHRVPLDSTVGGMQVYRVEFRPQRFWIEPYGSFELDPLMNVAEVEKLLLLQKQGGQGSVHLLVDGRIAPSDAPIGQVAFQSTLRARFYGLLGGAWTLAALSEAVQTLLVQHSCPASLAKAKSDLLYDKLGHNVLKRILDDRHPWQALKKEATAKEIELIPKASPSTASSSQVNTLLLDDPWKGFQPTGAKVKPPNPRQKERRRKQHTQVETKLDLSFFHDRGQALPAVDIRDLFQGAQGICVAKLTDIADHIAAICATRHTLDPSAVVLLGDETGSLPSSDRISLVTAPGWLGQHPTAFRVTMIQTGDDDVQMYATGTLDVAESLQTHKVFSFHVYRSECDRWEALSAQGIIAFLRDLGFKGLSAISQTWSLAWYNRGKKAEPATAEYHFGYLKVELALVDSLLRLGGTGGFYPNPRASTRGPDDGYRSLLLRGYSLLEARAALVQHATTLGLTKTRQGYGLRVLAEHYDKLRSTLFPNAVESSDSDTGGPRRFQLVGTPDNASRSLVKQALRALAWPAKVQRSTGSRSWNVTAQEAPPTRSFPLKGSNVLIVEQVAEQRGPVVATTMRKYASARLQIAPVASGPSTSFGGALPNSKLAQVEEQTATKVQALESRLDALSEQVEKNQQIADGKLQGLQTGLAVVQQQVDSQGAQLDSKMTDMFEKLLKSQAEGISRIEQSNRRTIDGLRQEYKAGYTELKDLLNNSPKARRVDSQAVTSDGVPIHVATLYLYPNAVLGSDKYERNCALVRSAVQVLSSVNGPCMLCGDFNIPWRSFQDLRDLALEGRVDAHEVSSARTGLPLEPTCKSATRHTFAILNSALLRFFDCAEVAHRNDLDSHAVLKLTFDFPSFNVPVWKWPLPHTLDDFIFKDELKQVAPSETQCHRIQEALTQGHVTEAFQLWSEFAEQALVQHCIDETGGTPGTKHLGRGLITRPVKRLLAAPRVKFGRPTDFRTGEVAVTVRARQLTKQVRRLQSLGRLLVHCPSGCLWWQSGDTGLLWQAVVSAAGFTPNFPTWIQRQTTLDWQDAPTFNFVSRLQEVVACEANTEASRAAAAKKTKFVDALDACWKNQGGKLAFRLLRDKPQPPVQDMCLSIPVLLSPQPWSPTGKAWIKVRNISDFRPGDKLSGDGLTVTIQDICQDSVLCSQRLTRRQAAGLSKTIHTADPEVWVPEFLKQWECFWQREESPSEPDIAHVVSRLPSHPQVDVGPLSLEVWDAALRDSNTGTMRGTDAWTIKELRQVPPAFVLKLLDILSFCESRATWPLQLTQWLLVLLRKTSAKVPSWDLLRPISVAGLIYHLWARMRCRQLIGHVASLRMPLVSPRLSTRALWYFLSDLISTRMGSGVGLCGLVLDITKCFNILDRRFLKQVMVHIGISALLVDAWFSALGSLTRRVLLGGFCYGASTSHTGVPEGDPLSIIATYIMAWAFGQYMVSFHQEVLPATYADNWQLLTRSSTQLLQVIPTLERFLECTCLPVSPSKCWVWSITPLGRKRLRSLRLFDAAVPLQLQGRELGADISYCFRKAAKVRNGRVLTGIPRFHRLAGLPTARGHKTRLLLSGVFPHVLHGAETCPVPPTVFRRLRSYTALSLNLRRKGSSPWLACLLGTYRCVDPEFILLMNRIQLFRQVLRELPDLAPLVKGQLSHQGRYRGPTQLLVQVLADLGWSQSGEGVFEDCWGRTFHLILSSLRHVEALLLTSWADKVCGQVNRRKYLEDLGSIDVTATTCVAHLLPSERALLIPQRLGAFYSGEFTKHFAPEASVCPLCGATDSRLHRVAECPHVLQLRATFPRIHRDWNSLAAYTQAFGLWPELDTFRPWQASLDAMTLPSFVRTVDTAPVALYTDGSCLHPRTPLCRIAAYAVVQAGPDGRLLHTEAGPLPGSHQTPFRAELLALGIAFALHSRPWVFTDCSAVAKRANRLLSAKRSGRPLILPTEHTDLWTFFALQLDAVDLQCCRIEWIPSHRDWSKCQGVQRVHAWFNDWADKAAKAALSHHRTQLYESHLAAWSARQPLVHELARFHAAAALMFTQESSPAVDPPPVQVSAINLLGPPSFCSLTAEFPPPSRHPSFTRDLARWLTGKPWVPSAQVPGIGLLNDMSWLELFWVFLWDTRGYPPSLFQGSWVCLSDDPVLYFALPCAWSLFRSFRSFLGSLLKAGVSRPWGHELSQVSSASFLGARFPCAGFPGRVEASLGAIRSLCDILAGCPKVSALRLPFV